MSVYKPKGAPAYVYDFQLRRHRFSGTTGAKSKREAEQVEAARKDAARQELDRVASLKGQPMTLDAACDRYWIEVGQFAKNTGAVEWSIDYLLTHLGAQTRLVDIGDDAVAELVSRRRGERVANHLAQKRRPAATFKRVSNATVNRSVLEPLRRILLRARDQWQVEIGGIVWKRHRLAEPKERVRSLSAEEEARLFAALPAAYHPIVRFALRTGCRAMECVDLRWSDVDWGERRLTIRGKGTSAGPKIATIPLAKDVRDLLFPLQAPGATHVFMVTPPRRRDGFQEPPRRITYRGLYSAFFDACRKAGITGLRIHDLRHTAATRIVKATGNLKLAMKLLRHEDISTTSKYAAVLDEDLREAMDAMGADEATARDADDARQWAAENPLRTEK